MTICAFICYTISAKTFKHRCKKLPYGGLINEKIQVFCTFTCIIALGVSAFSCADETPSNPQQSASIIDPDQPVSQVPNKYSGDSKKTNSAFGQSVEVNDTVFTLNNVVSITPENSDGKDMVFINVTIKNNTDIEYEISSLNNFFLALPDNTEIVTDIRARLYALGNLPKCVDAPITIPANGEFTGYLAEGFLIPSETDSFTVGFFPTLDNERDTSNAILTPVSAEDITHDDSDLK